MVTAGGQSNQLSRQLRGKDLTEDKIVFLIGCFSFQCQMSMYQVYLWFVNLCLKAGENVSRVFVT